LNEDIGTCFGTRSVASTAPPDKVVPETLQGQAETSDYD